MAIVIEEVTLGRCPHSARMLEQRRAKHRRHRSKVLRKQAQRASRPRTKADRIMRELTTVRLSPEYWPALSQEQIDAIKTWA